MKKAYKPSDRKGLLSAVATRKTTMPAGLSEFEDNFFENADGVLCYRDVYGTVEAGTEEFDAAVEALRGEQKAHRAFRKYKRAHRLPVSATERERRRRLQLRAAARRAAKKTGRSLFGS
jgi:hypothetical protein